MEKEDGLLKATIEKLMSTIENLLKENEKIKEAYQDLSMKYENSKEYHEKEMKSMREELKKENETLQNQALTLVREGLLMRTMFDDQMKLLENSRLRLVKTETENKLMKEKLKEFQKNMANFKEVASSFLDENLQKIEFVVNGGEKNSSLKRKSQASSDLSLRSSNGSRGPSNGSLGSSNGNHGSPDRSPWSSNVSPAMTNDWGSDVKCSLCSREFCSNQSMLHHAKFCQGHR